MRDIESDFITAGAQIIWILQENRQGAPASAQDTQNYMEDTVDSNVGIRVGDAETLPTAGVFESSPFIDTDRGFAMVVRKSDMQIIYENTHGNERTLDGQALLEVVESIP